MKTNKIRSWPGLIAAFAVFAIVVGYFSKSPNFRLREPEQALLKLSISHQGELRYECRQRSAKEIEDLPPNMRRPLDCPRERWPLRVTLHMDGKVLFDKEIPPTGLAKDGTAYAYRRLPIPAGEHTFSLSVLDSQDPDTQPDHRTETLELTPGQVLVVEYVGGNFRLTHPDNTTDGV